MTKTRLSLAFLATFAAPAAAQDGSPPSRPDGLRFEAYSDTAAELFWERSTDADGVVRDYRIGRDGVLLGAVDGPSFFTDELTPGVTVEFTVTAVDDDGLLSPPAAVSVATGRAPGGAGDPGDRPPAPANALIAVYSRSAAELFWDRAPAGANVVGTEIVRDGATLGTTDGTSFFDDARADGAEYRYELIAIDARGRRSAPAAVDEADGASGEPLPGELDLLEVGQELVRALAGYPLDQLAVVVDDLAFIAGQTTTIVWPDDDYYQVQNAGTLAEVCNGGPECPVVPGSYVVINHTTGERSPLEVPYVDPADRADAAVLSASGFAIGNGTIPIDRTRYGCENGGSVTVETGTGGVELDEFGPRNTVERRGYLFDDCRLTVRDGRLPDGGYVVDGILGTVNVDPFDRFSYADEYRYDDLSIVGDAGLGYRVDGRVERLGRDGSVQTRRRTAAIDVYEKVLPDGRLAESVTDGRFEYEVVSEMGPSSYRETLDADGTVRGTLSAGQTVTVTTEPVLTRRLVPPFDGPGEPDAVPFAGTIELLAEGGGSLYVNANPIVDPAVYLSPALVDLDYAPAIGRQEELNQTPLIDLPVAAPNCVDPDGEIPRGLFRDERTGRLECVADGAVPVVP